MNVFYVGVAACGLLAMLSCSSSFAAPSTQVGTAKGESIIPNQTLRGKVMCGYQGWFDAPGDGSGLGWRHFGDTPGDIKFDMWPDMTELGYDERYPTRFKNADGSAADLYSAHNEKTVLRHFKWMRDYGIDGVFLQRFASQLDDPLKLNHVDTVLGHVRKGAALYGRVYGVMYDVSGLSADDIDHVIDDWKHLVDTTHLTQDDRYVRDNGKPVVAVWGIGFDDGARSPLLDGGLKLVNFLKHDPVYGGNCVMIGVPYKWRTTDTANVPFAKMEAVVEAADIVSPWQVGTETTPAVVVRNYENIGKPDLDWCTAHHKEYMPVVFPGFSWHNMTNGSSPSNQIPRLGGRFLWTQYVEAKKMGATMLYQAMFDEVDEGTAIFKVTNNPPDGQGKSTFVTYEGLPSDFYLKLVGQGTQLMRGEIGINDDQLIKNAPQMPVAAK